MTRNKRNHQIRHFADQPKLCGGKRRYASEREAERVREEQELLNPGLSLRIYKCIQPGCHGWHLTRGNPVV